MGKLLALMLLAIAQIGGYFTVSDTPERMWSGQSFTVDVRLEMPAREDVKLAILTTGIEPSTKELVIPKGSKQGSVSLKMPEMDPYGPELQVLTWEIRGSKVSEKRDVTVFARPINWNNQMRFPR